MDVNLYLNGVNFSTSSNSSLETFFNLQGPCDNGGQLIVLLLFVAVPPLLEWQLFDSRGRRGSSINGARSLFDLPTSICLPFVHSSYGFLVLVILKSNLHLTTSFGIQGRAKLMELS